VHRGVIEEEAQRLFGREFVIEDTTEPGLTFDVVHRKHRSKKPKVEGEPKETTLMRVRNDSRVVATAVPVSLADKRALVQGAGMEQRGESQSAGIGGYTVHLMFPGNNQTKKGVVIQKGYDKAHLVQRVLEEFKWPQIRPEFVDVAAENWKNPDGNEATLRFRCDRPKLSELRDISLEDFRAHFNPQAQVILETDGACSGNPGPGGWGYILAQGNVYAMQHGA
jgi:hypothetical protein